MVQLLLQSLVFNLVVVRWDLPEVKLSLKQLGVVLVGELWVDLAVGTQVVDNIFEQSTITIENVAGAIILLLQLKLVST